MRTRRSKFHPLRNRPNAVRVGASISLVILALLAGVMVKGLLENYWFGWPLSMIASLLGPVFLPRILTGSWQIGWQVDEEGLKEVKWLRRGRRIAWTDIADVRLGADEAVLELHNGDEVHLAAPLTDWLEIAVRAQARLGRHDQAVEEPDIAIPEEEVASWLGVAPGVELRCRSPYQRLLYPVAWLGSAVALAGVLAINPYAWFLPLAGLVYITVMLAVNSRSQAHERVLEVRARPSSLDVLTVDGWHTYDWGSLWGVERRGLHWVVSARGGDILLPPLLSDSPRLIEAIRKAIAARTAGHALPRMAGYVPEAALSRARSTVAAERGLYRHAES